VNELLDPNSGFLEAIIYAIQVFSICAVFYSIYRIGLGIYSLLIFVILAVGCLLSIVLVARGYNDSGGFQSSSTAVLGMTDVPLVELPTDVKKIISTRNRPATILLARSAYVNHAKIIDYLDSAGNRVRFSPENDDILSRDKIVARNANLELLEKLTSKYRYKTSIFLLISGLLGYSIGAIDRRRGFARDQVRIQ
jgi:hypothetical protein